MSKYLRPGAIAPDRRTPRMVRWQLAFTLAVAGLLTAGAIWH